MASLDISEPSKRAIAKMGHSNLTPVQEQTLPSCLSGSNVLAKAKTGMWSNRLSVKTESTHTPARTRRERDKPMRGERGGEGERQQRTTSCRGWRLRVNLNHTSLR